MTQKEIRFSQHALLKLEGYGGRKIAQGPLDESRVLRVVYEEKGDDIIIVTFYPGRRQRYEKNQI